MVLIGHSWQHLGAWVNVIGNLGDDKLDAFAHVGGRYIVVQLQNSSTAEPNQERIEELKAKCKPHGIRVGIWVNCFGEDPAMLADETLRIVNKYTGSGYRLAPVVLDTEAAYQGNTKMSFLLTEYRRVFPLGSRPLAVTTNSVNDSVVYNGRKGGTLETTAKSFRDLNVHVLSQWYDSPAYGWGVFNPWTQPVPNMKWVKEHGFEDNWFEPGYADKRAVRLNQIHAVHEVTGVESSNLAVELADLKRAKQYGFTKGVSIYLLENAPLSDFPLLAQYRNILYTG